MSAHLTLPEKAAGTVARNLAAARLPSGPRAARKDDNVLLGGLGVLVVAVILGLAGYFAFIYLL